LEENKLNLEKDVLNKICNKINSKTMYSPAQLAYAGDAVYELLVRSHILNNYDFNLNKMHKLSVRYVKADAQAYIINKLKEELSEEELRIVKRGRNAKITSSPKNVDYMNYRYATGFEALLGYLFLNNNIDRLLYIFNKVIEIIDEKDDSNCD